MVHTKPDNIGQLANVTVLTDFPGATLGDYSIHDNRISASLREEPLVNQDGIHHDYNWHFVFGLRNDEKSPVQVEVAINCDSAEGLSHTPYITTQTGLDSDFSEIGQIKGSTDTFRKYFFRIDVPAQTTVYVSNTYYRSLTLLESIMTRLTENCAHCKRLVYGKSVEGRDLIAYQFQADQDSDLKPTFLITSGFHPMEADTFATETIVDYITSTEGRNVLESCNVVVVPVVNPDGFVRGFNGCNARGINLYWDFRINDSDNAPESYNLWQLCQEIMPSLYVDFHAYTFQLHRKKDAPYLKPLCFYTGQKIKELVGSINAKLVELHDGRAMRGRITFAPSTLSYKLTKEFNTIAYAKYHLHISDGLEHIKKTSLKIFTIICHYLKESPLKTKQQLLSEPYGNISRNVISNIHRKCVVCWYYHMKPFLRNVLAPIRKAKNEN